MADADPTKSPSAPTRAEEVTLVADFPSPWGKNDAAEIAGMKVSVINPNASPPGWAPSEVDFFEVVRADVKNEKAIRLVKNFGNFLAEMQTFNPGTLKQVNLITHSSPGIIPFGGDVKKDGQVFFRNPNSQDPLNSERFSTDIFDFLNGKFDPATLPPGTGLNVRADLRSRFRSDAKMTFYGCDGGAAAGTLILIELVRCLNIAAAAFSDHIEFRPTFDGKRNVILSRSLTRFESKPISTRTSNFAPGFRHLIPDVSQSKPATPAP